MYLQVKSNSNSKETNNSSFHGEAVLVSSRFWLQSTVLILWYFVLLISYILFFMSFQVNLSVNLKKPMIPLLMEKMSWPPVGSMGPIFGESLFIRFYSRQGEETSPNQFWPSAKFQELLMQIRYYVAPEKDLIQESKC